MGPWGSGDTDKTTETKSSSKVLLQRLRRMWTVVEWRWKERTMSRLRQKSIFHPDLCFLHVQDL